MVHRLNSEESMTMKHRSVVLLIVNVALVFMVPIFKLLFPPGDTKLPFAPHASFLAQPVLAGEGPTSAARVAALELNAKRQNILEEGAKREGELMIYSGASGIEPVAKGFMEKYPFVKTEVFRTRTQSLIERTRIEASANRLGGDVLVGGIRPYEGLKSLLTPYKSRWANFSVVPTGGITSVTLIIFAYNTKRVVPVDVPKKLDDLLLPLWKNKLGFYGPPNTFPGIWTGMLVEHFGRNETIKFLKDLSKQAPFFYTSGSVGMQSVVTGEVDIGANTTSTAASAKKSGSPIDWVALEPTMGIINVAGIFRDSRHPHAAMLFLDYLLGPEGQEITQEEANFLTMKNIESREVWGVKLPTKIRLESPDDGKRYGEWNKMFLEHVATKN